MIWYPVSGPASDQCSTSDKIDLTLCLNAFRGEPASSWFDWHFTPNHNSSADFSTSVGSNLHVVLPTLHSGHGQITKVRVYLMLLIALFRLAFALAPCITHLTLQHKITRRLILQQERNYTINSALAVCMLTVSGFYFTQLLTVLFTFPSLYWFTIGYYRVFSLSEGSRRIQTGFHVPRLTRVTYKEDYLFSITWLSHSMAQLSSCIHLINNFVTSRELCKTLK